MSIISYRISKRLHHQIAYFIRIFTKKYSKLSFTAQDFVWSYSLPLNLPVFLQNFTCQAVFVFALHPIKWPLINLRFSQKLSYILRVGQK